VFFEILYYSIYQILNNIGLFVKAIALKYLTKNVLELLILTKRKEFETNDPIDST